MTSELKVDKITPASGTNTQIGEAGDTTNLSAGTVTLPTSIITGQTEKTTLVDADKFLIADSADSNAFKHVQKSNLPSGGLAFINSVSFDAGTGLSGFIRLFDPLDSSKHTNSIYSLNCVNSASYTIAAQGSGTNTATTDDAFIRCKYSTGNITSGTISLYGIRNG